MASLLVLTKGGWREHGCWANPEKELQLPTRDTSANDQLHHQPNYPTSLTLNITEGIPMMTLAHSAAKTEFDPLVTPLLPDREPRVPRQDTQEEHWPVMVLYAIIKEVPLRQWKEFLRVLSLTDRQLDRVEPDAAAVEPGPDCKSGGRILSPALHGPGWLCLPAAGLSGAAAVESHNQ
ncbi:unnamed protein product [Oncorhynchus mykiss]|uniref:Uncharacterized protein n=1 Tax=Oncorhynchus mykiss TaxID=8022 RepID=A0A060Y7X9_ONCMY|nr:unnamed protein product [Oncorhynchus mykiss]